jgi:hypothetical protein
MEDTGERISRLVFRVVACYLAAGLAMTVAWFAGTAGHADAPFTQFPDWLMWTPVSPVLLPGILFDPTVREVSARAVVALLLGPVTFVLAWLGLRWRAQRRR